MPGHPRILRLTSMTLRNNLLKVTHDFWFFFSNITEFLDNESNHSRPEKLSTAIMSQ